MAQKASGLLSGPLSDLKGCGMPLIRLFNLGIPRGFWWLTRQPAATRPSSISGTGLSSDLPMSQGHRSAMIVMAPVSCR